MEDIRPILTLEDLREALDLSHVPAEDLPKRFEKIATALLTKFAIQKGEQLFYITDIEFYYYADDHKDFITYPRKCEEGEWFFHPSGVDITFKSNDEFEFKLEFDNDKKKTSYKPILNSKSKFGGILIRSIIPVDESTFEGDPNRLIDHPLNVSDFLFDHFKALRADNHNDDQFPVLVKCQPHHKTEQIDETRRDIKKIQDPKNINKADEKSRKILEEKESNRKKKFETIWNSYSRNGNVLNDNLYNNLYDDFTNYLMKEDLRYNWKKQ